MKIAGFWTGNDAAYALMNGDDGTIIVHNELERFNRIKMSPGDPFGFMLQNHSIEELSDLKYIGLVTEHYPGDETAMMPWDTKAYKDHEKATPGIIDNLKKLYSICQDNGGSIHWIGHHHAHAAHAFHSSGLESAIVVTLDGGGRDFRLMPSGEIECNTTAACYWYYRTQNSAPKNLWQGDGNETNFGTTWSRATTQIFGLSAGPPRGAQEGTVMAMAALGDKDRFFEFFAAGHKQQYFEEMPSKQMICAPDGISYAGLRKLITCDQDMYDMAASMQHATEDGLRRSLKNLFDQCAASPDCDDTAKRNLCLSGGVMLNAVAIGKLCEWFGHRFDNIYVCPVPYDAGHAIGCAQAVWCELLGLENPMSKQKGNFTPYLGRQYTRHEVMIALASYDSLVITETNDTHVLQLLNEQNIISVFGGGSESGRRALGNRSILADPRSNTMKDTINEKVKHRQWYRPFAPSILREEVSEWFTHDFPSPYMSRVLKFKEEKRSLVPAVVHLDGTARLQTVIEEDNKWYYNFIKQWKDISGVPILLNTSFNDREPIVEKPEHAIACFMNTDIDYLYFFDYGVLVSKKDK